MKGIYKRIQRRLRPNSGGCWPDTCADCWEKDEKAAGPEFESVNARMDGPLDNDGRYGILVPGKDETVLGDRSWVFIGSKDKAQVIFDALRDEMEDKDYEELGMIIGSNHPIFKNITMIGKDGIERKAQLEDFV
jgi:hypothetical protein